MVWCRNFVGCFNTAHVGSRRCRKSATPPAASSSVAFGSRDFNQGCNILLLKFVCCVIVFVIYHIVLDIQGYKLLHCGNIGIMVVEFNMS